MFEVGETYQDGTGCMVKCVGIDGETAYLAYEKAAAYRYSMDGKSELGSRWDIKPPVKWVTIEGHYDSSDGCLYDYCERDIKVDAEHNFTLTFPMIDGKPDWSQAKVTAAE